MDLQAVVAVRAQVRVVADLPAAAEVHPVEAAALGPRDLDQGREAVRVQVTVETQAGEIMARTEDRRKYLTVYRHRDL